MPPLPRTRTQPIRFAVLGSGAIAQRRHLPELHTNRHARIVAVADPVAERVAAVAEQYQADPLTDWRGALKRRDVDAVIIASPNRFHAPMSIAALRAGKHVMCEKPMAMTVAEARRMAAAATRANRRLMIAFNERFMPPHVEAHRLVREGRIGRVLSFRSSFQHGGPESWSVDGASSWFMTAADAGMGAVGDLAVHKIDLLQWLIGQRFEQVGGFIETLDKRGPKGKPIAVDDTAVLTLSTERGAIGTITASWTSYGRSDHATILFGDKGVIRIGDDERYPLIVQYGNGDEQRHTFAGLEKAWWPRRSGIVDAFVDCLRLGRPAPVTADDGLSAMRVLDAAIKAAKRGKCVRIR